MRVSIQFNTNSAAFEDPFGFESEVRRILRQAAIKLSRQSERQTGVVCEHPEADDVLLDTNGNRVGTVRLERE